MGKTRSTYRTFTTSTLKNRSSIPSASDISEQSGYIDCVNISLNSVKSVLSASSYSLYDLCRHANVNHWSGFGPTVRSTSNAYSWSAALVNSDPTECKLGDFAGYDHNAPTPGWYNDPQGTTYWVNSGSQCAIAIDTIIGQVKYEDLGGVNVIGVLKDGSGNVRGWGRQALSAAGTASNLTIDTDTAYYTNGITLDQDNMTISVYIDDGYTISSATDVINGVLCRVPNTDDAGVAIHVKKASSCVYNTGQTAQPPSPWVNNNGALGMNWTSGYCTIGYDIQNPNNMTDLHIYAVLRDWTGATIGSADFWTGAYNAYDSVSGSVYLGMTNIPSYGYHVQVYIEESQ